MGVTILTLEVDFVLFSLYHMAIWADEKNQNSWVLPPQPKSFSRKKPDT